MDVDFLICPGFQVYMHLDDESNFEKNLVLSAKVFSCNTFLPAAEEEKILQQMK